MENLYIMSCFCEKYPNCPCGGVFPEISKEDWEKGLENKKKIYEILYAPQSKNSRCQCGSGKNFKNCCMKKK